VTSALAEIIQQAGALTGMARESLLPAVTGNGARKGAAIGNGSAATEDDGSHS
jgi:hypothetical protein